MGRYTNVPYAFTYIHGTDNDNDNDNVQTSAINYVLFRNPTQPMDGPNPRPTLCGPKHGTDSIQTSNRQMHDEVFHPRSFARLRHDDGQKDGHVPDHNRHEQDDQEYYLFFLHSQTTVIQ